MVVQAHLKSGGGELTRENVRLMGGAVAALRREQCAAAAEEVAVVATKGAVKEAVSLVARISVLDDQSVRLTTHLPGHLPAARGGSAQENGISHPEQPGQGQAWLLALGDFNLDPTQVVDEVRAVELHGYYLPTLHSYSPAYFTRPLYFFTRCTPRGYTASAAASAGRLDTQCVCIYVYAYVYVHMYMCVCMHVRMEVQCASIHVYRAGGH